MGIYKGFLIWYNDRTHACGFYTNNLTDLLMDQRLSIILTRYPGIIKKDGDTKLTVECPVGGHEHDKTDPKCDVFVSDQGTIAVNCHKCSDSREVYKWFANEYPECFPRKRSSIEKKTKNHTLIPAPDNFEFPDFDFKGQPLVAKYIYTNTDGTPTGYAIYRHLKADGSKSILRLHTARKKDGSVCMVFSGPEDGIARFYGLHRIKDGLPLIVVEGEKCVDWGNRMLGNTYNFICWDGGAGSFSKVKWDQLSDFAFPEIILWPDNDEQGLTWALYGNNRAVSVRSSLRDLQHSVRVVNPLIHGWPDKYDIADALNDSVDCVAVIDEAGTGDEIILKEVYQACVVAREDALGQTEADQIKCGNDNRCRGCHYSISKLIKKPGDITLYRNAEFLVDCVFMEENNMFWNVRKGHGYTVDGFSNSFAKQVALMPEEKRNARSIFLESQGTTQVSGRTFRPNAGRIVEERNGRLCLNNWNPARPAAESNERGVMMWLELLHHLVPNEEYREHLLDWMAFTIQRPEEKINWQILFASKLQGVGKDSLFTPLADYFGRHSQGVTTDQFLSEFTYYYVDAKFLIFQELQTMSNRVIENRLKPITTSTANSELIVNDKNEKAYRIPNLLSIVAFSNEDLPIKFRDVNERRWFVLRFDGRPLDARFFTEFHQVMHTGSERFNGISEVMSPGVQSIIDMLMDRDISSFNYGGMAPHTHWKDELVMGSNPLADVLLEAINEGTYEFGRDVMEKHDIESVCKMLWPKIPINNRRSLARVCDISNDGLMPIPTPEGKCAIPKQHKDRFGRSTSRFYILRNHDYWLSKGTAEWVAEAARNLGPRSQWEGPEVRLYRVEE